MTPPPLRQPTHIHRDDPLNVDDRCHRGARSERRTRVGAPSVKRTMKSLFGQFLLSVSTLSLMFSGCGSQRVQELPAWVINPPSQCAMGSMRAQSSSELTKLGAIARGRAALSHQLQTQVEGIIRSYIAEGEDLKGQISEDTFVSYSAQSTEIALQGTRARQTFKASDPYHTLYALVCVERAQ